jgi:hypothetical protein
VFHKKPKKPKKVFCQDCEYNEFDRIFHSVNRKDYSDTPNNELCSRRYVDTPHSKKPIIEGTIHDFNRNNDCIYFVKKIYYCYD